MTEAARFLNGIRFGLGVAGLALASTASATPPASPQVAPAAGSVRPTHATFAGEAASVDTRRVADWAVASGDNGGLPFIIVDKVEAKVFVFSDRGLLLGASPALLGLAHGDDSPPGIGKRKLADILPRERITPSGRFVAGLGQDFGAQDILWVDYEAAISLHRVFTGNVAEHRLERLATPSTLDNRISYGCINVPAKFYDGVVHGLFTATKGIVYVLPETRSLAAAFPGFHSAEPAVLAKR